MKSEVESLSSPQLAICEQNRVVVALSTKQIVSLHKKSEQSDIPFDTLKEVYERGYRESLSEQVAFNRVNSFIAGGAAMLLDQDLDEKRGLWANIHAKRERIKRGSGERMRKPGSEGAPTPEDLKRSQSEEYTGAEKVSRNSDNPSSRFIGTNSLTSTYKKDTPGYTKTVKRVVTEMSVRGISGKLVQIKKEISRGANMKLHKTHPGKSSSSGGGNGD